MLVQDFQNAVVSLAKACEMYVNHFGELAIECAEVYFLYGKALFRLSQQQAGVLGGALNDGKHCFTYYYFFYNSKQEYLTCILAASKYFNENLR